MYLEKEERIYGFIGTGHITVAVVHGLLKSSYRPNQIFVSPRNAEKAASLAQSFSEVTVAESNQEVVDKSKVVFICVRPQIVEEVLSDLKFEEDHIIISLVPTTKMEHLSKMVFPANKMSRCVPLPPFAEHIGSVLYYSNHDYFEEVFKGTSALTKAEDEDQLHVLWTYTALISAFYELLNQTSQWAIKKGVPQAVTEKYAASMYHSLSSLALEVGEEGFSAMAEEAATPGGLNEHVLNRIMAVNGFDVYHEALDEVLKRVEKA